MTSNAELLELAAKAVGIVHRGFDSCACGDMYHPRDGDAGLAIEFQHSKHELLSCSWVWNPMDDDADAHRLAVKLGINILHSHRNGDVVAGRDGITGFRVAYGEDANAATRRAITEAAAAIGRGMP